MGSTKNKRNRVKSNTVGKIVLSRKDRVNKRNILLVTRYYYWSEIRRLRFDDVLEILSTREFFVEGRTITNALLDYSNYLSELCKKKTTGKELKKEFPGWDWN